MLKKLKKVAKDALAVPAIRKTYETGSKVILGAAGGHRLPATMYSLPGFLTFNREQYAVLAGRRAYYLNLSKGRRSHVELRRNVHRLEKGILMQPRREVFARDYIEETVEFYRAAVRAQAEDVSIDPEELTWARDVLTNFFSIVTADDPTIARARAAFDSAPRPPQPVAPAGMHPYPVGSIPRSDVAYEDLLALARQRRSVRWFQDRPVPRELVDKAMLVARESPTACNRLPYEYRIFDDPALVEKVGAIPFGAAGYRHQIPTLVVVLGRLDSYFSPRDRHAIYIDASLATMGFMLALETLGLSSSVINWPDFEPLELKMARTLGLEPHERVVCLVAVGYPDPDSLVAASQKKSLDVLRSFNVVGK